VFEFCAGIISLQRIEKDYAIAGQFNYVTIDSDNTAFTVATTFWKTSNYATRPIMKADFQQSETIDLKQFTRYWITS